MSVLNQYYSIMQVADLLSAKHRRQINHQYVRMLFDTGAVPDVPKVGAARVVQDQDIEAIEVALRERGKI